MTRRQTGPSQEARDAAFGRAGGWCLRCESEYATQIHHRKPRGMGGTRDPHINDLPNLVGLCLRCHEWIESHRKDSYASGWLVARSDNPAERPLITPDFKMIMLLADGTKVINQMPDNYDDPPF